MNLSRSLYYDIVLKIILSELKMSEPDSSPPPSSVRSPSPIYGQISPEGEKSPVYRPLTPTSPPRKQPDASNGEILVKTKLKTTM